MTETPPDAVELARALGRVTPDTPPEEIRALVAGMDALFAAHQDRVYATCLRYMGQPEQARDLAQDALLRAYQKLPTFRGEARFTTWLVGIARYECLNALRRHGEQLTTDGVLEPTEPGSSVLASLRRQERETLLLRAAESALDDEEQRVVWLRYGEGLPLARIDALLAEQGIDTGASGARGVLQRCRRKLQRALRDLLEELGHGSSLFRESRDR